MLPLSLLSVASAFHIYTVRSGSRYQYSEVGLSSDGHWSLNGESHLELTLDANKLVANGRKIDIQNGYPVVNDVYAASNLWAENNGNLAWSDSSSWYICPDNNNNIAQGKYGPPASCTNAIGVVLFSDE